MSDLVEHAHASFISKKLLIEEIKAKYIDLKKTHIDAFVKECFEKKKQPLDSKVIKNFFLYFIVPPPRSTSSVREVWCT